MLKFFRTNHSTVPVVIILVLMLVSRLILYLNVSESIIDWSLPQSPFSLAILNVGAFSQSIFSQLVVSFFLVLIQVNLISILLSKLKNQQWKSYLSPWLFILFLHSHQAFILLSPQLISFTFILLSLTVLIQTNDNKTPLKLVFLSSLFIGISSAFWTPSIFFILMLIYGLFQTNSISFRTILMAVIAFGIPWIYIYGSVYLFNIGDVIFNNIKLNKDMFQEFLITKDLAILSILSLSTVSILFSFKYLNNQLKQISLFFNILIAYFLCYTLLYILQHDNNLSVWVYLALPSSILLNIFFNSFKRYFVAEAIHVILLLIILVNLMHLSNG